MEQIASRYGLALYSLALDKNKVVEWQKEVKDKRARSYYETVGFTAFCGHNDHQGFGHVVSAG